ncbi:MAG: low temperature requirement protein A [Pseudonocardiaceae bacterium]
MSETLPRLSWRRRMTGRDPDEWHRASTPLELLFDLTFVVAVAQAGTQLHHALAAGHAGHAVAGSVLVFFGIWWAWVNFTWFASAYDTDDVPYRLLTLLQMGGVLVFAAGIPLAFEHFDFTIVVIGYVIMRLALVTQWLRAAAEHPAGRAATLRYAGGVTLVQLCWVGRLWLPGLVGVIGFVVLVAAELAVPAWAEFAGRSTPWHPDHITERYGLFTIIVLGEAVAATMTAVQQAMAAGGVSGGLLFAAVAGLVLVFVLWWSYFKHASPRQVRQSLRVTFAWAYAHYAVFAAVAALGAGLQVVIGTVRHETPVSPVFAAFTVALPAAIFLIVLGMLTPGTTRGGPISTGLIAITAIFVLLAALTADVITLSVTVLIIAMLVALLLAYHLAAAHRESAGRLAAGISRKPTTGPEV